MDPTGGGRGRNPWPLRGRGRREAVAHQCLSDVLGVLRPELDEARPVALGKDGLAVEVDVRPHPLQEEPAECPGVLRVARHLAHPPRMFPGEVGPQGNAEFGTAGGQDTGTAGHPNRCSGVAPHPENGGPCGFAGPEGEGKFFLERHGQARYHGIGVG